MPPPTPLSANVICNMPLNPAMQVSVRPERLCRGLPDVFERYLRYCKELEFAERPNYAR